MLEEVEEINWGSEGKTESTLQSVRTSQRTTLCCDEKHYSA